MAVAEQLGADALIGTLVRSSPGRRSPGHVDGNELAVRAVLGQQVSVAERGPSLVALRPSTASPWRKRPTG